VNKSTKRWSRLAIAVALTAVVASCGDDDEPAAGDSASATATDTAASDTAASSSDTAASDTAPMATEPTETTAPEPTGSAPAAGEGITLAINPWTGSAVNAQVAKVVLEAMGTPVDFVEIDEFATWPGMEDGSIDAVLEVWPSGHAADYETYVTTNKTVVDLGLLGPEAKIGWYVPTFIVDQHPELATWEGFMDPDLAGLFATAESGDLGQFLMGDPTYVTYDEQIIANLGLPLQYVVGGSEAAVLTALDTALADQTPVLVQFWKPHWYHLEHDLTEVKLPDVTDECLASAAAGDGGYACDYAADALYKAASAGLEAKNPTAFAVLSKLQLTNDQQSEIAGMIDRDGMDPAEAAQTWVDANPDVVATWTS
jgi:glycine betaine/proline transport system substrate-binding protein